MVYYKGDDGKCVVVHFGSSAHHHYKDLTGLELYKDLECGDSGKCDAYVSRLLRGVKDVKDLDKSKPNYWTYWYLFNNTEQK